MSFFNNLVVNFKQLTGIGGVKFKVKFDSTSGPVITQKKPTLSGTLELSTDTPAELKKAVYKIEMVTKYKEKNQDREKYVLLGQKEVDLDGKHLGLGETLSLPFKLTGSDYTFQTSAEQGLMEKGGVLGALGALNTALYQKQVLYFFKVEIYFKNIAFHSQEKVELEYREN